MLLSFFKSAIFITCFVLISIFSFKVLFQIRSYLLLSNSVSVQYIDYSVEKLSKDKYVIKGNFEYLVDGKKYSSESLLKNKFYPNPWSADHAIKNLNYRELIVWHPSKYPNKGTLVKAFPKKPVLSLFIILGVLIYFSILFIRLKIWGNHGKQANSFKKKEC